MNYYPHHIGDYITATAHLTMLEDGAYRRLLDLYYSTEKKLPSDRKALYRLARARTKEEHEAVDVVIEEFFNETDDGWFHSRCDEEIEKARVLADRARANGKKGGRPPKSKPSHNLEETQPVNSGLSKQNPEETQNKPSNNPTPKPPIPIPLPKNQKEREAAAAPPPHACAPAPAHEDSPAAAPPDASEIPADPPGDRLLIPDEAPKRATQIVVLLRRNGADQRIVPNDRRVADWARDGVTDAEVLLALETAKARRKAQGSDQSIGTAYLAPIIADLRAAPPEAKAGGGRRDRYAKDAEQIQAMARWADEQLRQGNPDAQFPRIEG